MKRLYIIFTVLFFLFSCSASRIALPKGIHGFDECFGNTAGGSPICFEWSIQQINRNMALVNVDGFKTYERLVCSLKQTENIIEVSFDSYVESEIQTDRDKAEGDVLFRIKKNGNSYFAYDLESPETGEIMVKEFELLNFQKQ